MAVKLIATDLDGTFLQKDHETVSQKNIEAFESAHKKGVKTVIASGRTKKLVQGVLEQVPCVDYLITSNGAVTYDVKNDLVMFSELIDSQQTAEILKFLDSYGLPYDVYCDGDCFVDRENYKRYENGEVPPIFLKVLGGKLIVVDNMQEYLKNRKIEKVSIMNVTPKAREELWERVHKLGELHMASAIAVNMEINSVNANKGYAVKKLAESLGIERSEIMCFGDGENDCEMLEYAGYSFAMNNGSSYAKNSAKYIADDNDKDGVGKAVFKYVLEV